MHLYLAQIVLSIILLLSCGESKEKPRPEYGIENLKFGFADVSGQNAANELADYSGSWLELERFQYIETIDTDRGNTIGRLAFINLNKLNGRDSVSHCASETGKSDLSSDTAFNLPFNVKLVSGDSMTARFFSPIEVTFAKTGHDCLMNSSKSSDFDAAQFLYKDIFDAVLDQEIHKNGISGTASSSWQISVKNGKIEIITEERAAATSKMTRAIYRIGSYDLSGFASWREMEYLPLDKSDLILESEDGATAPEQGADEDTGSVNITIPESWFN